MNASTTLFMGGTSNPRNIMTFSWITLTYTVLSSKLNRDRIFSNCTPFKRKNNLVKSPLLMLLVKTRSIFEPEWCKTDLDLSSTELGFFNPTLRHTCLFERGKFFHLPPFYQDSPLSLPLTFTCPPCFWAAWVVTSLWGCFAWASD